MGVTVETYRAMTNAKFRCKLLYVRYVLVYSDSFEKEQSNHNFFINAVKVR